MSDRAVFLDKDGTLVPDVPYNVDPDRVSLMPGAAAGLRLLDAAGYRIVVVSNQAGVARGYFPEPALELIGKRLGELFTEVGVPLEAFYYCPHHPDGKVDRFAIPCSCRKPEPGLIHQAASSRSLDLRRSWLVGDILNDVEAGRRAGCRTVLIDNGNETEWIFSPRRLPHHVATDLEGAAQAIVLDDRVARV